MFEVGKTEGDNIAQWYYYMDMTAILKSDNTKVHSAYKGAHGLNSLAICSRYSVIVFSTARFTKLKLCSTFL